MSHHYDPLAGQVRPYDPQGYPIDGQPPYIQNQAAIEQPTSSLQPSPQQPGLSPTAPTMMPIQNRGPSARNIAALARAEARRILDVEEIEARIEWARSSPAGSEALPMVLGQHQRALSVSPHRDASLPEVQGLAKLLIEQVRLIRAEKKKRLDLADAAWAKMSPEERQEYDENGYREWCERELKPLIAAERRLIEDPPPPPSLFERFLRWLGC